MRIFITGTAGFIGYHLAVSLLNDKYESDNQITFFVPNDEDQYTLNELTDILI